MCGWFLHSLTKPMADLPRDTRWIRWIPGSHSCFMTDSSLFCLPFMTRLPRWGSGKESTCQFRRSKVWSLNLEDLLEEEMENHSSIFTWKIPWIEEPGRLQSIESQRLRYNWITKYTCTPYDKVCDDRKYTEPRFITHHIYPLF